MKRSFVGARRAAAIPYAGTEQNLRAGGLTREESSRQVRLFISSGISDDPLSSIDSAPAADESTILLFWAFRSGVKAGESNMTVSGTPITMSMPSNDQGRIFIEEPATAEGGFVTDHSCGADRDPPNQPPTLEQWVGTNSDSCARVTKERLRLAG